MLANLTAGLHAYGCHAEALAVHRHALTLPADHSRPVHLLEVAFAEALDGRGDAAGAALTGVRQEDLPEWDRVTFQLAQILVLASPAAAGGGGESAEAAWRLRALSSRVLASKDQVALRRLVRSAVVVGRHRGGLPGLVFGAWWVVNAGLRLNLRLWLQGFLFRRRHGAGRPRSPAGGDTSGASQAAPGREGSPERFDPGGNPRERTQS
jgi:hypothetical protein